MTTMKKIISVSLCFLFLVGTLVACNNTPEEPVEETTEKQSTEGLVFELNEDGASYKVALYAGEETQVFIHYGGTKSQWKYMLKGAGMNTAKDCTVYCSDGEYK